MLWPGYEGPKERWHAELLCMNRYGLVCFVESLMVHFEVIGIRLNRDSLLKTVRDSKKNGKFDAAHQRHLRFMADPNKAIDDSIRRRRAAKKAARRRKRNSR